MKHTPKPIHRITVLVLTGFLGSGKTTLLNNLLRQLPRSAVIINEFGATPIDQQLLREHNIPLSTLSGGCLCCEVRDALAPVLKNLRMAWDNAGDHKPFDRIIIETSGVANPEPVLDVLLGQNWLSTRYSLQGVFATLSAVQGSLNLARFPDAHAQIAWADTVVITHTDLADVEQIQLLEKQIKRLSPTAHQVFAVNGQIALDRLMPPVPKFRLLRTEAIADLPDHGFNSMALQIGQPLSWLKLESILTALINTYGENLVRLKGLVFDPEFDHPLLVQGSTGILHPPAHLPARASDDFISRLVFIIAGPVNDLANDVMQQLEISSNITDPLELNHV
ncbi:MAG: GTP-binding protein [Gammaproteobacteria bacterium]|nr:GTP-binding protein [Gammaproteobacteria bacterium]